MRLHQGGGSGSGSGDKPRSPFAFLGGSGSPQRKDLERDGADHSRRSSAPPETSAIKDFAHGSSTARNGGSNGRAGNLNQYGPDEEAARASDGVGRRGGAMSGPQFDMLWRASRGYILEKVMRRVELPSHVSRHRPPFEKADQRGQGGEGGAAGSAGLSRSGSSPTLLPSGEKRLPYVYISRESATKIFNRSRSCIIWCMRIIWQVRGS